MLIRNLKQLLNHGLELKKVYRVIKFNQKARLKPYIGMNTKMMPKKFFSNWWIVQCWEKLMSLNNLKKLRDINTVTSKKSFSVRTKLLYNKNVFWKLVTNKNEKPNILMNKPVYLGLKML